MVLYTSPLLEVLYRVTLALPVHTMLLICVFRLEILATLDAAGFRFAEDTVT